MRSEERYLEISHLTKTYPKADGGEAVIVRDFDLGIAKGEFVCLIGHSGCGKSTVLSIAAGLLPPTEGGVLVDDKEIPGPGPDRGVVFQSPCLLPWMTAFDNVMLGVTAVKPDAPRAERAAIVTPLPGARRAGQRHAQEARRAVGAACASASGWRARSRSIPRCCCSTSRSACSIR